MIIHNSYNKNELLNIIDTLALGVIVQKKDTKQTIKILLQDYINEFHIEELYCLSNENKMKKLSVKEKNEILSSAKKIISFCKNGYNVDRSLYKNYYELLCDAKIIAEYGDISSVRRAINLLNKVAEPNIEIIISEHIKHQLEEKDLLKKLSVPIFKKRNGNFRIEFF